MKVLRGRLALKSSVSKGPNGESKAYYGHEALAVATTKSLRLQDVRSGVRIVIDLTHPQEQIPGTISMLVTQFDGTGQLTNEQGTSEPATFVACNQGGTWRIDSPSHLWFWCELGEE